MRSVLKIFGAFVIFFGLGFCQEPPTIRSQANVVVVPTMVKDSEGHVVYGLAAKDFVIEDDGEPQTVHLDDSAESEPVSIVVAVQTGRRAKREFSRIRGVGSMLDPMLDQPGTRVAVVEFDSKVRLVSDFTHSAEPADKALKDLQPGDNGAVILNAVKFSVAMLENEPVGRQRILLLISELRDHGSHLAHVDDVVTAIGTSNIVIHALSFSPSLSQVLDTERGANRDEAYWDAPADLLAPLVMARHAMKKNVAKAIAQMTGGEYEVFTTRKHFETDLLDLTNRIHSRYMLSFEPHRPIPGLHQIRVRLNNPTQEFSVYSRTTYWPVAGSD